MSAFEYNPDDANPILEEGEYEAVIFSAKKAQTKKGDPKLEIVVKAYGPENKAPLITDNIVAPYGIRRLKQLCTATGIAFDTGEVDPGELVGQNLRVRTRIQHDETGQYDDQNVIAGYLPDDGDKPSSPSGPQGDLPTDDEPSEPASPAQLSPNDGAKKGEPSGNGVGKREAYSGYREAILRDKPDTQENLVLKNFELACKDIGKPEAEFTEADWIKVRAEGPSAFIPF